MIKFSKIIKESKLKKDTKYVLKKGSMYTIRNRNLGRFGMQVKHYTANEDMIVVLSGNQPTEPLDPHAIVKRVDTPHKSVTGRTNLLRVKINDLTLYES